MAALHMRVARHRRLGVLGSEVQQCMHQAVNPDRHGGTALYHIAAYQQIWSLRERAVWMFLPASPAFSVRYISTRVCTSSSA